MHDNDIVSKIEHLMVKYKVPARVCNRAYELAERSCWPVKYSKDARYVSIALGAALIYYNIIDACTLFDELSAYAKEHSTCKAADNVADYMCYSVSAPMAIDVITKNMPKLSSIEFVVLTAHTEIMLKRFCDEHDLDRAISTTKAYEYIKEHCVE